MRFLLAWFYRFLRPGFDQDNPGDQGDQPGDFYHRVGMARRLVYNLFEYKTENLKNTRYEKGKNL